MLLPDRGIDRAVERAEAQRAAMLATKKAREQNM
jgi:hypothetical protein